MKSRALFWVFRLLYWVIDAEGGGISNGLERRRE